MAKRIMVVEDDRSHRETLERHLSRSGYEVVAVSTGEGALSSIAEFQPDLVISDVRMPGMSGLDLLQFLRERSPDVDVVIVTAYEVVQGAINAMREGAYDYLVKPLDLDRLDEVVDRCLRDRDARVAEIPEVEWSGSEEGVETLVGRDESMLEVYKLIGTVAPTRAAVLIRGETGTGKELVARTIHANSGSADEPFISVNCTAVPETLLESELFGHVRGAFTGASSDRKGRFELAGAGTIFLDEIGDTSIAFQAKLLRVLQEREFFPVGSEKSRRTMARVLAATHRNLEEMVESRLFREDLYFRLRVIEITIPPLRERRSDIPFLANHFLAGACTELGRRVPSISEEVMGSLLAYDWPGNVRELQNAVTRAALLAKGPTILPEYLALGRPSETLGLELDEESLEAIERAHIQRVLAKARGNKSQAARILHISRPRLDRMIDKHGLVT
jgi:DNA-binding NtrC family response regulator